MKNFNQIKGSLIGLPTQLTISANFVSFTANTKTLENGTVIKAPIVIEILAIEGFTVTEKKVGTARKNVEFIDGKTQNTVWQMVKYTVK
jgi:hypothetical protein